MKIKTSELQGAALDWAVAKCEGKLDICGEVSFIGNQGWCYEDGEKVRYMPSTNWAQGGPIIEREKIATDFDLDVWNAAKYGLPWFIGGPTPLIAAMRCYVASKLGDEVEVPNELCEV